MQYPPQVILQNDFEIAAIGPQVWALKLIKKIVKLVHHVSPGPKPMLHRFVDISGKKPTWNLQVVLLVLICISWNELTFLMKNIYQKTKVASEVVIWSDSVL